MRYCNSKDIGSKQRQERQRRFHLGEGQTPSLRATYFGDPHSNGHQEPFAFLHRTLQEDQP